MSVFRRVDNLSEEESFYHKHISKVQESIKGKNSCFIIHTILGTAFFYIDIFTFNYLSSALQPLLACAEWMCGWLGKVYLYSTFHTQW